MSLKPLFKTKKNWKLFEDHIQSKIDLVHKNMEKAETWDTMNIYKGQLKAYRDLLRIREYLDEESL